MKPEVRAELLRLVEAGNDLEAAAALAGIKPAAARADKALMAEVSEAFSTANAKLRGQLLQRVLADDGDAKLLAQILEKREAMQGTMATEKKADSELEQWRQHLIAEVERRVPIVREKMRQEILDELKAQGLLREIEVIPPAPERQSPFMRPNEPLMDMIATYEMLDEAEPLPPSRAPALPRGRSVGKPRVTNDPNSPWYDGGGAADYPL